MNKKQKFSMYLGMAILAVTVVVGLGWLVWLAVCQVPVTAIRVYAILATALLPLVAGGGWWFGHTDARGRLAGIDQAVDKVMGAATKAAGLRVETSRQMRRTQEPPVVVLPDVEIIQKRLPRGGDVVEL